MDFSYKSDTGHFAKKTSFILTTNIFNFVLALCTSILIARCLGPKAKGIYSLSILIPSFAIAFLNIGISPATIYHIGKNKYTLKKILGNNLIIGILISVISILGSLIFIMLSKEILFKEIPKHYLLLALGLIPFSLLYQYLNSMLIGLQKIREYNIATIFKTVFFLILAISVLIVLKAGISALILSQIFAVLLAGIISFRWIREISNGISYKLDPDYIKNLSLYGIKAHLGNILGFLNYRLDMFLISFFLGPLSVGYYSISVSIAEKLWFMSSSTSTVLFPKLASEKDEIRRNKFTPLVSRNVFMITIVGAIVVFLLSHWIILVFYSKDYLQSIKPLQALLPGIVALSVGRILANDIAARGKVMLNNYVGIIMVTVNLVLNILWIPRLNLLGAALASTAAYSVALFGQLFIYRKISGNPTSKTLVIQKTDFELYRNFINLVLKRLKIHFKKKTKKPE